MSIDRIGKPPSAAPPAGASIASTGSQRPFSIREAEQASGAGAPATAASPADQVRRGEMSIDAYLDLRIDEATRHLRGRLGPEALAQIQGTLRAQLASDPLLQELVKSATGQLPPSEP